MTWGKADVGRIVAVALVVFAPTVGVAGMTTDAATPTASADDATRSTDEAVAGVTDGDVDEQADSDPKLSTGDGTR